MRIPWNELSESPAKAEQLFDLITHSVYGDRVITINGAGGDGGFDAWIEDLGQAVEFKSFTKLGKSQRGQVARSSVLRRRIRVRGCWSRRCTPRSVTYSGSPASPGVTPSR
ncbi:MAG TPA: hypothetical protein VGD71_06390 [Kribbella sp.]